MIQVIATIELKPGCRDTFLPILNENVPNLKNLGLSAVKCPGASLSRKFKCFLAVLSNK